MSLNIKNSEVERLATQVAQLARESKTEAIRRALLERKARLEVRRSSLPRRERIEALLRNRIWPQIPPELFGKPISREEEEQILGYGPQGV